MLICCYLLGDRQATTFWSAGNISCTQTIVWFMISYEVRFSLPVIKACTLLYSSKFSLPRRCVLHSLNQRDLYTSLLQWKKKTWYDLYLVLNTVLWRELVCGFRSSLTDKFSRLKRPQLGGKQTVLTVFDIFIWFSVFDTFSNLDFPLFPLRYFLNFGKNTLYHSIENNAKNNHVYRWCTQFLS